MVQQSLNLAYSEGSSQVLWEDGERVFSRGWRLDDCGNRLPVLLVAAAVDHPSRSRLDRLAHELSLKDELDAAWAVRPLKVERGSGRTMLLVLEDPGGEPLARLLGSPMDVGGFLALAIGAATALGKLHQRGLIHKDIKPANIVVDCADGHVRLTGFGVASHLSRERQAPEPPETIAGTLAYMAPEQTGRMNRSIDARSDLYALGVTLYQMLTGVLPLTAADPMEWVHCHIARQPVPPTERLENVPAPVSAIIMKLLAKTPEDRYQTAGGVERDLRRCLAGWEARRRIDDFPLGLQDTPNELLIPQKLYGRDCEIATLLSCFDRIIKTGVPELVLISGYAGIGKSSVVDELHKVLVPSRGLFASGKFDQYKRDIPYGTLVQAFQSLVRSLLSKSDTELASWRHALLEALGSNGPLMIDLIPELKLIIGDQPAVPELPPQQAQSRFQLVFRRFIGAFARPNHPLALFLDDLQWLDAATLDLLEDMLTRSDLRYLMLVGAYRDNEVVAAHPLMRKLDAIKVAGGKVAEIKLSPLAQEHLRELVADALRCALERAAPLANLVHLKTGGNPFFAIQFLSSLVEQGLLTFDHDGGRWSWDIDRIQGKGYTDNVVDLMVGKLTRLPTETQNALQQLACLGNIAEITALSMVLGISEEQLDTTLWPARHQELVERVAGTYRFVHDRVQEAAYRLIPEQLRGEAHLRIGRLLAANTPSEKPEAIFDIVNQLNRGASLMTSMQERERLAGLNLRAGERAKASTAYVSALNYLNAGAALLAEDCWLGRREIPFALELNRAECEFLTGALAEAEQRLEALSAHATDPVERAKVACLRVDLYVTLDQSPRAVAVGLDFLRHLGIEWSPHPTAEEARLEYELIWSALAERPIEVLVELPLLSDPASLATLDVLTKLALPALYTDANLFSLISCRAVNLSLESGNCDASSLAYSELGFIAGPRFGNYEAGFRFGQLGYDLVEKRGLKRFQTRIFFNFGSLVVPWTRHIRGGRDLVRRAFEAANQSGDLNFQASCYAHLNTNLLAAGDPLDEVQREAERGLTFAQRMQFRLAIDRVRTQLGLIRTLRGLTPTFGSFDEEGFDEHLFEHGLANNPALALAEGWYWIRKLQARFFAGDNAGALQASGRAQRLLWTSPSMFETAEFSFYDALVHAASYHRVPPEERQQHFEALVAHHKQLEAWAEHCAENFENRAALVGAEIARIEGRAFDAMNLYEQAILSAQANGFVHNEALANELAARFYTERGFQQIAHLYLRNARDCYLRWGADGKVRQLEAMYPRLRTEEPAPASTSTIAASIEKLDLATVIKVSQAISGEIVLEKLLEMLIRTALEQAGAERGLLILSKGAEQRIAAEGTTDDDLVTVHLRDEDVAATVLPQSVLHYVLRTRESVILDDASSHNPFSADPYIVEHHLRSILCFPLINQGRLTGILYLENNLAPRVFTPDGVALLKVVASQAAISLENSRLYRDVADREGKIRRLVDANIIGILIADSKGRILEANDAFLRIVGYDREDLVSGGVRWTELSPPEWRARDLLTQAELNSTGIVQPFEKEYIRKDGSRVPVLVGAALFKEGGDEGLAFVLDLTERKRAEDRLRVQHTIAQVLAEAATIEEVTPRILRAMGECLGWDVGALWRVDREAEALRCVELWHKASIEIAEFERADWQFTFNPGVGLPGRVWSSLKPAYIPDVVPDKNLPRGPIAEREGLHAAIGFPILLGSEVLGVIEFFSREIKQPDQELLDMVATIGSQIGQFIERKRAEEALMRSKDYLAEAQKLTHTGSWAWDPRTEQVLYCSEEMFHIYGLNPRSSLPSRENFRQQIHPEDRDWVKERFEESLRKKIDSYAEYRVVLLDGTVRHISASGHPVLDDDGELIQFVGTAVDVTKRKQAEESLRESEANLAHMNRVSMMGELAASLSHEIAQPIASARNNARAAQNFLKMQPPDLGEVREALSCVVGDADRAGEIIDRIREQIKKTPPRKECFDLNAVIKEVIVLARNVTLRNGVSVQTRLAEGLFSVLGDRVQLQQVLLNLILNAAEAMGSMDEGVRELLISSEEDGAGVVVAVRDSGPGIDPEHLDRVFDAFYTTKPSGTGMGLAICRSIIHAHGGRLWADMNKPRGAVFQFTLPGAERELTTPQATLPT